MLQSSNSSYNDFDHTPRLECSRQHDQDTVSVRTVVSIQILHHDKVSDMRPPDELVQLSIRLAKPERDLVILAEGNTSCRDGSHFWVKASGASLCDITESGFVACEFQPLLGAMDREATDLEAQEALTLSCVTSKSPQARPSVEAFMHAWLLTLPGVHFVGHVHPTAVLALVCSMDASDLCRMRFFPDEVVCCGPVTAWVPYIDPGLPLAVKIREVVSNFVRENGEAPKVIWMQNHGLIALGRTALEVESAILMSVKASQMVVLAGGLQAVTKNKLLPLTAATVERIKSRPDEHYRQELLWKIGGKD